MPTAFMRLVEERSSAALASGALQPIRTEQTELADDGLRFVVRWTSSASQKAGASTPIPGGPRDPDFNPFLSPEPALVLGPLGERHTAILNKFPVCDRHLVIARTEFDEQLSPLDLSDFAALARILTESGGLGFYNGGSAGGASQRHKHVQWLPDAPDNASLRVWLPALPAHAEAMTVATHPRLRLKHVFVRIDCTIGTPLERAAQSMLEAFDRARAALELGLDAAGLMPPGNVLVGDGWLLLVPRCREHFEDISINALSYGGTIFVRRVEQIETVRAAGPLRVLAEVAC